MWAASPLFLFMKLGEVTLLFVCGLTFLPFSQRTLMLSAYSRTLISSFSALDNLLRQGVAFGGGLRRHRSRRRRFWFGIPGFEDSLLVDATG